VEMTVRAGGQLLTAQSRFTVQPRQFTALRLPPQPPEAEAGEETMAGSFTLSIDSPRTLYVEEGPDAQWFIVAEPVPPPRAAVRLNSALPPDAQRLVLRHEAAHYEDARRSLERKDLQAEIEALHVFYDQAMAGLPLHERMQWKLQGFLDKFRDRQRLTVER